MRSHKCNAQEVTDTDEACLSEVCPASKAVTEATQEYDCKAYDAGCTQSVCVFFTNYFRPSHWKQDLLMLDDPIQIESSSILTGSITFTRNPRWRRHMSIQLNFTVQSKEGTKLQVLFANHLEFMEKS